MKNKKYKVFCYIRNHDNRVPCDEINKKFHLKSDYLDSLAGITSRGEELEIWDGVAQLTAAGEEYIDRIDREKNPPLKPTVVSSVIGAVTGIIAGAVLERIFGFIRQIWP